jgi:hypothetical protein
MSDQTQKNLISRRSLIKIGAAAAVATSVARFFGLPGTVLAQPKEAATLWKISGDYCETCSCDFLCPCITSDTIPPTQGYCTAVGAFHIIKGSYGNTPLDDLSFVLVIHSPEIMGKGNWTLGLIIDDRATLDQQKMLTAIASGQAGGIMEAVAPAIGKFLGAIVKPITFKNNGLTRSVSIPGALEQGIEGVPGADSTTAIYLENVGHFANTRLALAHPKESHLHAFGLDWDQTDGKNNGHFTTFSWQNA